jgi:hypothetical protein
MFNKLQFSHFQPKRTVVVALVLGIALLASACGGAVAKPANAAPSTAPAAAKEATPPASSKSAAADACALLSKDAVGKVLGQDVVDATGKGLGGVCTYTTKDLTVNLTVSSTGGIKFMSETLTQLGNLALVVPGLGDQAYFNLNSNTLFVLKGDAVYLFNINNSSYQYPEDGQAKQKALAEELLKSL